MANKPYDVSEGYCDGDHGGYERRPEVESMGGLQGRNLLLGAAGIRVRGRIKSSRIFCNEMYSVMLGLMRKMRLMIVS